MRQVLQDKIRENGAGAVLRRFFCGYPKPWKILQSTNGPNRVFWMTVVN